MKLATFLQGSDLKVGIVQDDAITPLTGGFDMRTLIENWDRLKGELKPAGNAVPLASVRLAAPVPNPSKILAIGLNYADHIAETGRPTPEHQVWFGKLANTINGPFDPVQIPKASDKIDYEVELVAVIGKRARHISYENAAAHVFGYMVGNDVSVRDWQRQTPQWLLGKSFDSHAPMGPWITTADEIGDPHRLGIRCRVNGETRQNSNTRELVFNVWDQIAHLSKAMTLEPGDLIFTGTPGGVGNAMTPPRLLKAGDVVRCEIDELGAIENVMEPEA